AMDDDFNTSLAITVMHEMAHEARKTADPGVLLDCGRKLKAFGGLLGVSLDTREETESSPEYMAFVGRIEAGIRERAEARGRRDYKKADEIRERLTREEKVILSDLAGGKTTWRRI
ncbi:MAG: cysteine--tRNA ligase, partial [Candidatus Omnitrophica bacterium]|nr:cysteine--tRNA ligase [Candidatus Omnitrophota bacterium]